jgi:hypothetical protein
MTCKTCHIDKPESDFHRTKTSKDTTCKSCRVDQARARRAAMSLEAKEEKRLRDRRRLQERNIRLRDEVYVAYGLSCSCCGETELAFLTIDHVNGRTPEDDKRGAGLYRLLIDLGFPDDYRLLCFNCNSGRERNGGICPHELARIA